MSDDLGTRLRVSIERSVRAPVDAADLLRGVHDRRRRARRSRQGLLVAVLVLALVPAGLLLRPRDERLASAPTTPAPPPPAVPVPPGTQPVSSLGLELFVPADWPIGNTECGSALSSTVVPPAESVCLALVAEPPGITVVEYRDLHLPPGARAPLPGWRSWATTPTTVSGLPAWRGVVPPGQSRGADPEQGLVVPDLEVQVTVRSPDPAAAALLDTAHVVDVDRAGCPTRLPSARPLPATVQGAGDRLLPGTPVAARLCGFSDLRTTTSRALTADEVARLQAALDALPPGTVPAAGGASFLDAADCRHADSTGVLLDATYPDGGRVQVVAVPNACSDDLRSVTNGARSAVQRTLPAL